MQRCSVPVKQGPVIPKFNFNSYTRQTKPITAPAEEIHVTLPEIDLEYQHSSQNDQSASGAKLGLEDVQSTVQSQEEKTGDSCDLHVERFVGEPRGSAKKANNLQTSGTSRTRREPRAHSGKRRVSIRSKLKKTEVGLADVLSAIDRGARDPRESQENELKEKNYQESIDDILDSLTQGVDSWDVVDRRANTRSRKKTRGHIKLKTHRPKGVGRKRNMASRRNNLETVVARSPSVCRTYSKEDILVPIEMSSRFISTIAHDVDSVNRVFGNNGWLMRRSKSLDRIGPMPAASSVSNPQKSAKGERGCQERNGFLPIMSPRPSVVNQRPLGTTRSYSVSAKRGTRQNADSDFMDQFSKSRQLNHNKNTKSPVMLTLDVNALKENDGKRSSIEPGVYRRLKSADLSREVHVDTENLTSMKCTLLQRESTNVTTTNGANAKQCDRVVTKEGKENMQVRVSEGGSPTNPQGTSKCENQSRTQPDTNSVEKKDTKPKRTNVRSGMNGFREPPKSILKIKQETLPSVEESSDSSSRTTAESSSSASSATRKTRKKKLAAERIARANLGLSEFTGVEIELDMGSGVVASHYPGDTEVELVLERKPTKVRFNSDDEVMEYVPWSYQK